MVVLAVSAPLCAIQSDESLSTLTVRRWGQESGIPEETFSAILAPGDGYVWLAANHGLVRFDGRKAKIFLPGNVFRAAGPGSCSSNTLSTLLMGSAGSIWGGSPSGCLFRLVPDRFGTFANFELQSFDAPNRDRESDAVIGLANLPDGGGVRVTRRTEVGNLIRPHWSESVRGVPRNSPETSWAKAPGDAQILFSSQESNGRVWVMMSNRMLYRLEPESKKWAAVAQIQGPVRRVLADRRGRVWIATNLGLHEWSGGKDRIWTERDGLPSAEVIALKEDQAGCLWMGFRQAIGRICGNKVESMPLGVADEELISTIEQDPQGQIWAGGRWGNLYRLSSPVFRIYTKQQGLAESHLTGVAVDRQGSVWGSLRNLGLARIAKGKVEETFRDPRIVEAQTLVAHPRRGVLAATAAGIYHLQDGRVEAMRIEGRMQFKGLPGFFDLGQGQVLFSNLGGNYRLTEVQAGAAAPAWRSEELLGPARLRQWAKDGAGRIWAVAQFQGLHELRGSEYVKAENAPSQRVRSWYSIFADPEGLLWIGTTEGVEVYSPAKKAFLTKTPLLLTDHVFHITQDQFGKVWCATRLGLVRFGRKQAMAALDGGSLKVERFGEAESLPTTNFGLVTSASGAKDLEGKLWFPGLLGLVSLNPADFERTPRPPAAFLHEVRSDGTELDLRQDVRIGPGTKKIEFLFQTVKLDALGGDFCRLRMVGFDPDWIQCSESRSAQYTNLPPGQYEFLLETSSRADHWDGKALRMPITMEAALYERMSVQAVALVVLIGGVGMFWWRRHRESERQRRELEAKVEERTLSLAQAMEAAQSASRAKTEFLATMSHEIRTPMNGVLGAVQVLADSPLDRDQQRLVSVIRQSGEDLVGIVDDILSLSKVEAGKLTIESAPLVVAELCESLVSLFQPKAEAQGVAIGSVIDEGVPRAILTDPQRLRQILLNLLGNAVKFTEAGEVRLRVSVDAGGGVISFEVKDTGVGIAEENIATLFDPFVQADSSTTRRFGGSGLGLAIVSRFVEAMQGSVGVESEIGKGSVFRVSLPLEAVKEAPAPERPARKASASQVGLKVLLAEDNAVNQMVFQRMLARLGCEVWVAPDGQEALNIARETEVDLVLMDCQMPVLDGYETTRALRGMGGRFSALPIIAITASAMEEDRQLCLAAGMNDFLSKPLILAALEEKLEQWSQTVRQK